MTTLSNTFTNLVSIWYHQYIKYHCQYDTSIGMVSSQYGTDSFVSVWYCHNTDSGYSQKNFDAQLTDDHR
jgi:hypothetical protein